jgi:hypothetical protein
MIPVEIEEIVFESFTRYRIQINVALSLVRLVQGGRRLRKQQVLKTIQHLAIRPPGDTRQPTLVGPKSDTRQSKKDACSRFG